MAVAVEEADAYGMAVDENGDRAGDDAPACEVAVSSEASAQVGTYWDRNIRAQRMAAVAEVLHRDCSYCDSD